MLACPQEKLNEILDSPEVAVACQKLTTVDHDSDEAKTLKQGLPEAIGAEVGVDGIGASDSISTRELFGQGTSHRVYHSESVRPSVANRAHRPVETMAGCSTWCDR